jgi:hypothetical protein
MIRNFPDTAENFNVVENNNEYYILLPEKTKFDVLLYDDDEIKINGLTWHLMCNDRLSELLGIVYDSHDKVFFDTNDPKEQRVICSDVIISMTTHLFKKSALEVTVKESVANCVCNDHKLFNDAKPIIGDCEYIAHHFYRAKFTYNNVVDTHITYYIWLSQDEQQKFCHTNSSNRDFIQKQYEYIRKMYKKGIHYHIPLTTPICDMHEDIINWFYSMEEKTNDFKNISYTSKRTFYQIEKINPFSICNSQHSFCSSIIDLDCIDFSNFSHDLDVVHENEMH